MGVRHSSSHGLLCAYLLGTSLAIGKFHIVISSDGFWCSWLTLKGGIVTPLPCEQSRWASYRVTVGDWSQRRVEAEVRCRLCYILLQCSPCRSAWCAHTMNSGFVICWRTAIPVFSTKKAPLSHWRYPLTDVFLTLWALLSRLAHGGTLQTLALGTAGRTAEHWFHTQNHS